MDNIKSIEKRIGVDIRIGDVIPKNSEGCVGIKGMDKMLTLQQIINICINMTDDEKPNVIVKDGKGKYYPKRVSTEKLDEKNYLKKRCVMYIIVWE